LAPLPEASPPQPAPPPAPARVGGHIGIATPLVTVSKKTTSIADQFTILNPIGIGIKTGEHVRLGRHHRPT
jgi:hypothetical protein